MPEQYTLETYAENVRLKTTRLYTLLHRGYVTEAKDLVAVLCAEAAEVKAGVQMEQERVGEFDLAALALTGVEDEREG